MSDKTNWIYLTKPIDDYRTVELAAGCGTWDHLLASEILNEKITDYDMSLYTSFIDYEKVFHSVENFEILNELELARINNRQTLTERFSDDIILFADNAQNLEK